MPSTPSSSGFAAGQEKVGSTNGWEKTGVSGASAESMFEYLQETGRRKKTVVLRSADIDVHGLPARDLWLAPVVGQGVLRERFVVNGNRIYHFVARGAQGAERA